jgi:hypothetical protein
VRPTKDEDGPATVLDPTDEGDLMAADTADNEKIVRRTLEAFEAADERGMREGLARDFVFHNAPPGFAEDADGFVQLARHVKFRDSGC